MDRSEESKLVESGMRPEIASRIGDIAKSVRSRGEGSYSGWEWRPEAPAPSQRRRHRSPVDGSLQSTEPQAVRPSLQSMLMDVQMLDDDDDEELFFSRQSSMSSMRSGGAAPFRAEPARKSKIDIPSSPLTLPPASSRGNSGVLYSQPLSALSSGNSQQPSARSSRMPSGLLYPCPNPGSRNNSCQLNAAHFTLDNKLLSKDLAIHSGAENVERIFKRLIGQSRLQRCSTNDANASRGDFFTGDDLSDSPVSTLDCPQSPTSSERSFRGKSTRKSLRSRSEEAILAAAQATPVDPATPRPKSQLAQYLLSISALTESAKDDDDLEGPSEAAWLEPDSPYDPDHPGTEAHTPAHAKKKPSHERWSSNSSSWNLSLVPKPLRTVTTIVHRRHHFNATVPGRKSTRRGKVDSILPLSLTASYDGGAARSRTDRKSTRSELNSGRSWWPDLGSGRKSSVWACSGRLQMEGAAEPDLHEPDMEQANNLKPRHQDARARVDEEDFPFDNPIASSFVFQEAAESLSLAAARKQPDARASLHQSVISVISSENESLQFSDNFHDPELDDGSISDSDGSHLFSLGRDGLEWASSCSFKEFRDIVDGIGFSGSLMSGISGRGFSGCLDLGDSGRFSVDLQRGQKLDKALHPLTPDVRLQIFKSQKSTKRSLLSPCLPFLHRSNHSKNLPKIDEVPEASAPSRRLQPVNSFTARLGPVAEDSTLAAHFQYNTP